MGRTFVEAVNQGCLPPFQPLLVLQARPEVKHLPTETPQQQQRRSYSPPRFMISNSWQMDKRPGFPQGGGSGGRVVSVLFYANLIKKKIGKGGNGGRAEVRTDRASNNFKVAIWLW